MSLGRNVSAERTGLVRNVSAVKNVGTVKNVSTVRTRSIRIISAERPGFSKNY